MIVLNITVYTDGDADRYVVNAIDPDTGEPKDVTDQYELVALDGEHRGFALLERKEG